MKIVKKTEPDLHESWKSLAIRVIAALMGAWLLGTPPISAPLVILLMPALICNSQKHANPAENMNWTRCELWPRHICT